MGLPDYNRQFLQKVTSGEPIFNNAVTYGVAVTNVSQITVPVNAKQYWRAVGVHHLTGDENRGNHHVYADVLDGEGRRVNNSRLVLIEGNAAPAFAVVDKPANEAGTNFPLWSKTRASVAVAYPADNPFPSEVVTGIRTDHADEGIGNTWGHHSFYVVFQLTAVPEKAAPPPSPVIESKPAGNAAPLTLEETIALSGQPLIIPLNPEAMFYKIARQQNLGERLSNEYDAQYDGKTYRAQVYERGIVYAQVGDWGNVKIIARTN